MQIFLFDLPLWSGFVRCFPGVKLYIHGRVCSLREAPMGRIFLRIVMSMRSNSKLEAYPVSSDRLEFAVVQSPSTGPELSQRSFWASAITTPNVPWPSESPPSVAILMAFPESIIDFKLVRPSSTDIPWLVLHRARSRCRAFGSDLMYPATDSTSCISFQSFPADLLCIEMTSCCDVQVSSAGMMSGLFSLEKLTTVLLT